MKSHLECWYLEMTPIVELPLDGLHLPRAFPEWNNSSTKPPPASQWITPAKSALESPYSTFTFVTRQRAHLGERDDEDLAELAVFVRVPLPGAHANLVLFVEPQRVHWDGCWQHRVHLSRQNTARGGQSQPPTMSSAGAPASVFKTSSVRQAKLENALGACYLKKGQANNFTKNHLLNGQQASNLFWCKPGYLTDVYRNAAIGLNWAVKYSKIKA